ncbi:MAG: cell division protein FtsA [Bacteroidetes bacterium GWF2_49_14]|nr:MAG: cell division protein FtsA [Bacteroidetes bacterium GWF2_49_14]HBB91243.1 cell division protein FtsA [Bacteroidales bacterium]
MAKKEIISAIDIGTTKIVAMIAQKTEDGKFEILGLGNAPSSGVKRGVVVHIDETVSAIELAKEQAEEKAGYRMGEVYVGIAGQHIKSMKNRNSKYIDNEEISQGDVDYLHDQMSHTPLDPGEEILHVMPQSYIVDSETDVTKPVGMSGRLLEANFNLVIGKVASARNISKCIERVELKVKKLILEPLASATAVLTADEREAGVVLVDIGGGTTDIAVFYNDVVRHTAVIPFGGNVITNDIKEGCSILLRQAEALKVQFGSAMGDTAADDKVVTIPGISGRDPREISFKNLAYIIQARMEEILDAVAFEIDNSGYAEKVSAGIVVTGGGAMLKNLPQLIKFKTGYDVRIGYPNQFLVSESDEELFQPMYSTGIGLIIEGSYGGATHGSRSGFTFRKKSAGQGVGSGLKEKIQKGWSSFFSDDTNRF